MGVTGKEGGKVKYIYQMGIIGGISFIAEALYVLLPFPVPASVYGLIILLVPVSYTHQTLPTTSRV